MTEIKIVDEQRSRWCTVHSWEREPEWKLAPGDVMNSGEVVLSMHQFCEWCGAERIRR